MHNSDFLKIQESLMTDDFLYGTHDNQTLMAFGTLDSYKGHLARQQCYYYGTQRETKIDNRFITGLNISPQTGAQGNCPTVYYFAFIFPVSR